MQTMKAMKTTIKSETCPVLTAVNTIGGKWKIIIIYNILEETRRFGELKRLIPGITQKMLTQQLRELEADGIIHRKIYTEIPPKVEYSITVLGKKLEPIFASLCRWGTLFNEWNGKTGHEEGKVRSR